MVLFFGLVFSVAPLPEIFCRRPDLNAFPPESWVGTTAQFYLVKLLMMT